MNNDPSMSWWAPLPPPLGVHPDSAAGRMFGIVVDDETYVCWCCRNECGAVYSKGRGVWTMTRPIAFKDFLDQLKESGTVSEEATQLFEFRRWSKACMMASS